MGAASTSGSAGFHARLGATGKGAVALKIEGNVEECYAQCRESEVCASASVCGLVIAVRSLHPLCMCTHGFTH